MLARTLPLLLLAACVVEDDAPTAVTDEEIRHGDPDHAHDRRVFAIYPEQCSSVNVRYPRCMMTARHCLPAQVFAKGDDVSRPGPTTPQQPKALAQGHPGPT